MIHNNKIKKRNIYTKPDEDDGNNMFELNQTTTDDDDCDDGGEDDEDDDMLDGVEKKINLSKASLLQHKPQDTSCSQQRLPAWKPLLMPKFVVFLFLTAAFVFIPIGILLYMTSNSIYEFSYDYTDCFDLKTIGITESPVTCNDQILKNINYNCKCRIEFYENQFQYEPLNVYYSLDTYFQNHRRYVRSRDYDQLFGIVSKTLINDCEPYQYSQTNGYPYAPCGAIANSLFNDTFQINYKNQNDQIRINISKKDLAWNTDKHHKFRNPNNSFQNTVKPPNWKYNITYFKDGYANDDLIVWMRTAAFPSFRKLYGRIYIKDNPKLWKLYYTNDTIDSFKNNFTHYADKYPLPKGQYYVDIDYRYLVKPFQGRKSFILANTSWIGGKCYFLAYSYIIFGSLCFITAVALHIVHYFFGKMSFDASKDLLNEYEELKGRVRL